MIIFSALLSVRLNIGPYFSNWFYVFIPLWLIGIFIFIYLFFFEAGSWKYGRFNLLSNYLKIDYSNAITMNGEQLWLELINFHTQKSNTITFFSSIFSTFDSTLGRSFTWLYFLVIFSWFVLLPMHIEGSLRGKNNKLLSYKHYEFRIGHS